MITGSNQNKFIAKKMENPQAFRICDSRDNGDIQLVGQNSSLGLYSIPNYSYGIN